jgi:replicative DNA helicase
MEMEQTPVAQPGPKTEFECEKTWNWYARRADNKTETGWCDNEEQAKANKKPGDMFFSHAKINNRLPEAAEKKMVASTAPFESEHPDIAQWYWQATFIYGVANRRDFLIDSLRHVRNKFLHGKPFRYIYALYHEAYVKKGLFISQTDFRQRLLDAKDVRAEWKESIYMCFRSCMESRAGITEDEFKGAMAEIIRHEKAKQFDIKIAEAVQLKDSGKMDEADQKIKSFMHSFSDVGVANKPVTLAKLSESALDQYQHVKMYNFSTFSHRINDLTGGGWKGETWIVGGYTSDGKTQLVKELVYEPMKMGDNVLFVSLEMMEEEMSAIFQTRIAYDLGFPHLTLQKIRRRQIEPTEWEDYKKVVDKMKSYGNMILHQPEGRFTMDDLERVIDRVQSYVKLDIVVVDYLELIDPDQTYESHRIRVKEIMRRAKRLATQKELWVVIPHQISRDGRARAERRLDPYYQMADLQESSGVEQNCVVMAWIYQDEDFRNAGRAKMGVAKNRMGKLDVKGWEIGTDWQHCRLFEDGLRVVNHIPKKDNGWNHDD